MRMYEAQHSRDMKGHRPTAGENMKLALARVKGRGRSAQLRPPLRGFLRSTDREGRGRGRSGRRQQAPWLPPRLREGRGRGRLEGFHGNGQESFECRFFVSVMMIGFDGALNGGHHVEVRAGCEGETAG